jgi:cation diffusion facilitator family transporter
MEGFCSSVVASTGAMNLGQAFELPPELRPDLPKARRAAWLSIVLLGIGSVVLAFTMGQSEAMKTAWVTEVLSMLPPAAYLIATRYELRPPTERFPFGYFRSISVSYLVAACALTLIGLWLLWDALTKLLGQRRPPIGSVVLFGHQLWAGWTMIAALSASMLVGMLLGKLKEPLADRLHDKALKAEAQMNRDEWISEGAAIAGLLLVAFGFWWGDAGAAAFISIEIVRDGWHNVRQVIGDLMDEAPTVMEKRELEALPRKLQQTAERMPWVERAAARLREQGRVLTGEVFVVPKPDTTDLVSHLESAANQFSELDWRLHGLVVAPVSGLDDDTPPRS